MGNLQDLTGNIYGDFKVISFDNTKGKYKYFWNCECINCGYKKSINISMLKTRPNKCNNCNKDFNKKISKGYKEDLSKKIFGHLTVIEFAYKKNSHSCWRCRCNMCGKEIIKSISFLNNSRFLMCDDCRRIVSTKDINKKEKQYIPFEDIAYQTKENDYIVNGDTTIINGNIIIDTEDLEKILQFKRYVSKNSSGYAYMNWKGKELFIHRLLMDLPQYYDYKKKIIVDHINGNRLDNRKCNLRVCNKSDNPINCAIYKNNTSGVKGVTWMKRLNKWQVIIQCKKEKIYLGIYSDFEEAKRIRLEAEEKYFGEFKRKEDDILNGKQ